MKSRPIGVLQHNQAGLQELTVVINWKIVRRVDGIVPE
jgi:hypothetical protein